MRSVGWLCGLVVMGLAGCDRGGSGETNAATAGPGTAGGTDLAGAQEIYRQRCATCHGERGEGNGPAAAGLNPQPRSFASGTWQQQVTDAHIEAVVLQGGAAVGMSPAMPPNPDLRARPEVVAGLRELVRSFGPADADGTQ